MACPCLCHDGRCEGCGEEYSGCACAEWADDDTDDEELADPSVYVSGDLGEQVFAVGVGEVSVSRLRAVLRAVRAQGFEPTKIELDQRSHDQLRAELRGMLHLAGQLSLGGPSVLVEIPFDDVDAFEGVAVYVKLLPIARGQWAVYGVRPMPVCFASPCGLGRLSIAGKPIEDYFDGDDDDDDETGPHIPGRFIGGCDGV